MAGCELQDNLSDGSAWSNDEPGDAPYAHRGASYDHGHSSDSQAWAGEPVKVEEDALVAASRAYQLEMYEESLKKNIIVAMDTGTGKTRVAILRIRAELERSPPHKIVWFLAPTVFLCDQQFKAIVSQIPGAQAKVITGQSGVDAWSTQSVWDTVLLNVRVVVGTHQVLLDAMHHGFVRIQSISLLVFDEAHACVKEHAGKRIMSEFYYPALAKGDAVPAILGLTASPVQGTKLDGLDKLEQTLHAVCRTPKRHRAELVAHTRQPSTSPHVCDPRVGLSAPVPQNAARLQQVYEASVEKTFTENMSAYGGSGGGEVNERDYGRSWKFMKAFCRRACHVYAELGSWAADYYVHKVIRRCVKASKRKTGPEGRRPFLIFLLQQVQSVAPEKPYANKTLFLSRLSAKVQKLVEILEACETQRPTGIVFVKERPMAAVLARVLSLHPRLRGRFRAGHVVGMSQMFTDVYEASLVLNPRNGSQEALRQFRGAAAAAADRRLGGGGGGGGGGWINLLVATSVMEEGIDVPACNLVVCIDELTSLKAYIQRRGRAREEHSQLHLLLGADVTGRRALTHEWEELEREMKRRYEDGLRELADLDGQPRDDGLDDDAVMPPLQVAATQARLGARDAKMHLEHFCMTSSSTRFVDRQPVYMLEADDGDAIASPARLWATVQLPITLPPHLRRARSRYAWRLEEDACADAAFQAYKALYAAGLLSDNLLPPKAVDDDLAGREVEGRPGVVTVRPRYRPWAAMAQAWAALDAADRAGDAGARWLYRHLVRLVDSAGVELCRADLLLPGSALPVVSPAEAMVAAPVRMFWSPLSTRPWTFEIGPGRRELAGRAGEDGHGDDDDTMALLSAAYGHRWPITRSKHGLVRFACVGEPRPTVEQLGAIGFSAELFADQPSTSSPDPRASYLVRDVAGAPYIYQGYAASKPPVDEIRRPYRGFMEDPEDVPYVFLRPLPKQVGFLHQVADGDGEGEGEGEELQSSSRRRFYGALPAGGCWVDRVPMALVQFGALIPRLTQVLEVHLVAAELLSATRLRELPMADRSLIATAISAPAARLHDDYELLEFVGDAVLKLIAATNCAAQNPDAPEGHLSLFKDRLVANSRLCRAATEFGLDRFIMSTQWSLRAWRDPDLGGEAEEAAAAMQVMSTKTLADVVEALIGAAHVDGGLPRALQCMRILLPERRPWLSLEAARDMLFAAAPETTPWRVPDELEQLLGYRFRRPSLLAEAMTHSSMPSLQEGGCMERLEFIGDAVLDYVIMQELEGEGEAEEKDEEKEGRQMTHEKMHLLRTTLANAAFLGFVAMEFSISAAGSTLTTDGPAVVRRTEVDTPLWAFMRHGASEEMARVQQAARARHAALREAIQEALWSGSAYPWVELTQLRPEKMFSDLVEAVIGAVWVDSGSLGAVAALLENMGVLPYMRRAVAEDVHLLHPKEELGRVSGNARVHYGVVAGEQVLAPLSEVRRKRRREEEEEADEDVDESSDEDENEADGTTAGEQTPVFTCRLSLNDVCVAEILDGKTREEVEARAAVIAVRDIKGGRLRLDGQ